MSVVYEDSNYGLKGYAEFEKISGELGVCMASTHRVDYDEPGWGEEDYDNIVRSIARKGRAKGKTMENSKENVAWLDLFFRSYLSCFINM